MGCPPADTPTDSQVQLALIKSCLNCLCKTRSNLASRVVTLSNNSCSSTSIDRESRECDGVGSSGDTSLLLSGGIGGGREDTSLYSPVVQEN